MKAVAERLPLRGTDPRRLVPILYGFDFARRRHVDDFAHDLFEWLAIGAAVLVHFFRFAPTAIEQDCGSRDVSRMMGRTLAAVSAQSSRQT